MNRELRPTPDSELKKLPPVPGQPFEAVISIRPINDNESVVEGKVFRPRFVKNALNIRGEQITPELFARLKAPNLSVRAAIQEVADLLEDFVSEPSNLEEN